MPDSGTPSVPTSTEFHVDYSDGLDTERCSTQVHVLCLSAPEGETETAFDISYPVDIDSLKGYVDKNGGKQDGDRVTAFGVVKVEDNPVGVVRANSASGQPVLQVDATTAAALQPGLAVDVGHAAPYVVAAVDTTQGAETLTLASNLTAEATAATPVKYLFGFCREASNSGQKVLAVTAGLAGIVMPLQWVQVGGKRYMVTAVDKTLGAEKLTLDVDLDANVVAGDKVFYRIPFLVGLGALDDPHRKGRKLFENERVEIGAEVANRAEYIPSTIAIRVYYAHASAVGPSGKTVEFCFAFRYYSKPDPNEGS